jgi:signal transduction histidine kinase
MSIFAALLLGVLLCGYMYFVTEKGIHKVEEITNKTFQTVKYAEAFHNSFKSIDTLTNRVLSMTSFITKEEIKDQFDISHKAFANASKGMSEYSLSPSIQQKFEQLNHQKEAWLRDSKLLLGLEKSETIPILEIYKQRQENLHHTLDEFLSLAKKETSDQLLLAEKELDNTLLTTFVITLTVSIVFTLFAFLLARGLSKPLVNLVHTAEQLATGNTDVTFTQKDRKDEIGAVVRAVAGFRDGVIDRLSLQESFKLQTEELKEALSKEKELNELQSEFVSMASHEFRTPLAIIDASARRMERRKEKLSSDDISKRTQKIHNAVNRMLGLIESTLMVARADKGKLSISPKEINLTELIEQCCENQNEIITSHIVTYVLEDLPDLFIGDQAALTQIMTNLLSNAVKYSPDNFMIEVQGWVRETDVYISVKDHGLGIDKEDLSNLFGRFFRAKTSTGIPGTGIGLNLVRTLVEMHEGEISAQSTLGKGSTFSIRLPIKDEKSPRIDQESQPQKYANQA